MSYQLFSGLKNISVLGASGKMGRGIVLLFARSILQFNLKHQEKRQIFAFDIASTIDKEHRFQSRNIQC